MTNNIEQISVPDIGGAEDVDVIEVFVKPGDVVAVDDPLITLEGDKAAMDVPSPSAGTVKAVQLKVGDKASEGTAVISLEVGTEAKTVEAEPEKSAEPQPVAESVQEVRIPDIGGAEGVDVIEVAVKPGDVIKAEDALLTLEGDKAAMDVPSPFDGEVTEVKMKVGDKVSADDLVLLMKTTATVAPAEKKSVEQAPEKVSAAAPVKTAPVSTETFVAAGSAVHAGPAVRRIAREFGVDLTKIRGSGAKGRIVKQDVQQFVKAQLQIAASGGGSGLAVLPVPTVNFAKFGEIETKPLSKIQKSSGANLHRNWVTIPHVTQFGEVDTTELEAFRQSEKKAAAEQGIRLTPLVFLMKAVAAGLKEFPNFNASLDASGQQLILKKYFHIGVAVDTPNGLVVPVIRDVDQKGLLELAKELGEISVKARDKKLTMADMQGGCFSISSLGGIGGSAFTPIINAPEVAILGVSRSETKPIYIKGEFVPRLMLPLSLSYDHRVIDGADGARFFMYLSERLSDIRTLQL